jgi:hypothetical protein
MEQTPQSRTVCKGPWRQLAIAASFASATALIWAAFQFGTDGDKSDAAAAGAQIFGLSLGPIWAGVGARRCRCTLFRRKTKARFETDQRPWHER